MVLTRHLKRIAASKFWPIKRKESTFVMRPFPSGLSIDYTLPIGLVLKEVLKIARNNKEVNHLIINKKVLINNKPIKDIRSPIKLFDVLSIPETKQYYRLSLLPSSKLTFVMITEKESKIRISKLINKKTLKKGKVQLNFFDGTNIISDENYPIRGTAVFETPENKITSFIPLESGVMLFIIRGTHVGTFLKLKEKINSKTSSVVNDNGDEFLLNNDTFIAAGKDSPVITLK